MPYIPQFQYQSLAAPIVVAAAVIFDWFIPLSEPPRSRVLNYEQEFESVAPAREGPVEVKIDWFQPLSEPSVKHKRIVRHDFKLIAGIPTAVTVNPDSWFVPLSEPVRFKRFPTAQQQTLFWSTFTPAAEVVTVDKWYVSFTDPVRIKSGLTASNQQFIAFNPFPFVKIDWFSPLSEPSVKAKKPVAWQQALVWTPTEVVNVDKWFAPFREPARVKAGLPASEQQSAAVSPFPFVKIDWFQALSEPSVKTKKPIAQQQELAWSTFTPTAETVTVDMWFAPFREPVRTKLGLPAGEQQFFAFNPSPITPSIDWYQAFSDPSVKVKKPVAQQQDLAWGVFTPTVNIDSWYAPFRDPVRVKLGLAASAQQFLALNPFPITKIDWFQGLSEPPVKFKKPVAQQQDLAWGAFTPTTEVVTLDKWYAEFRNPVWIKAGQEQEFDLSAGSPAAAVTEDQWHQPWSEPLRLKRFPTAQQQAFTASITVEVVTVDKWYAPFRDPVRVKQGLSAGQQQFFAFNPRPFIKIDWFQALSEPSVKVKKPVAQQQVVAPQFTENVTEDKWHQPWSIPRSLVRARLAPSAQPFLAYSRFEVITEDKWHQPWSEPIVKSKRRLREASQQFLALGRPVVSTNITLILNVTETGDVASMTLQVAEELVQAIVSVFEIVPEFAISARVEVASIDQTQAIVSVFEIEPNYAISGRVEISAISQIQAIVSIIEIEV